MENETEKDTLETAETEGAEEAETESVETPETEEESEVSREEFEQLKKQNAQLFARAKKAEEKAGKAVVPGDEEFRPRVEFLLSNRDINAEEYDHLAAVAMRSSGKITLDSLTDAKKSEKDYISYLRKKVEDKSKSPSSTPASGLQKVLKSSEDIQAMTPAEHQKYEEQVMRAQNSGL